jgi:hypothetical protein
MHRTRTRFAARAHRVAKAIETRGIAGTYALHDRVLANRRNRRRYAADPIPLDDVQREIVRALDADGYHPLPFTDLFDEETWEGVAEQGRRFAEATAAGLDAEAGGEAAETLRRRQGKEFVVRLHSYGVDVGFDDPWFRVCASRRMLDVANAYLRMWSKLEYVDMWYSVPQPESAERVSSQRWHRDFNDRNLVKAFLYLVDVDEAMGPLQYVPGSAGNGRHAGEWPWRPLGETYPPQDEFERRVPTDDVKTFTAPAGTLIFVNTSGFHRGGLTTTRPRVLATATYSTPASLKSLTDRSFRFTGDAPDLDPVQREALT